MRLWHIAIVPGFQEGGRGGEQKEKYEIKGEEGRLLIVCIRTPSLLRGVWGHAPPTNFLCFEVN